MIAKGFKGKYFSLQAITATVSTVKLQKQKFMFLNYFISQKVIQLEDDPPIDELTQYTNIPVNQYTKPCFCNIFFACLTHKVLKLFRINKPPICRCRKTKSGIAPPLRNPILNK